MLTKTDVIFESARFLSKQHCDTSDRLNRTKRLIAAFTLLCDRLSEDEPQECLQQIASYIENVFGERAHCNQQALQKGARTTTTLRSNE
ncbi:hypothetical protein B7486_52520 [cyanobacterium TDX16]|nr:hypothetical protein B7486_52520 [cyanobacterium TDX16]